MSERTPRYERLIWNNGRLVPEEIHSEDTNKDGEQEPEGDQIDVNRRKFLAGIAGGIGTYIITKGTIPHFDETFSGDGYRKKKEEHPSQEINQQTQRNIEVKENTEALSPIEQMRQFGEVKDLQGGLRTIYTTHLAHLNTETGKHDMEQAVQNLSKLDMTRFTRPFVENALPQEIAYLIAIQETRGKTVVSSGGARGIMGIMPVIARAFGHQPKGVDNPYTASEVSAKYFKEEQRRFGDNIDMLLHVYNGGAGLFGFTEQYSKIDRTPENFYRYMQEYINHQYRDMHDKGYFSHTLQAEDRTLSYVSRRFNISLDTLLVLNKMDAKSIIHKGDIIKIPFDGTEKSIRKIFNKEFEVLFYAPEVRAKYHALKEYGPLAGFELPELVDGPFV